MRLQFGDVARTADGIRRRPSIKNNLLSLCIDDAQTAFSRQHRRIPSHRLDAADERNAAIRRKTQGGFHTQAKQAILGQTAIYGRKTS